MKTSTASSTRLWRRAGPIVVAAVLLLPSRLALPDPVISSQSESTPFPGVRLVEGRTTSPSTSFYAAFISLCTNYVHVEATEASSSKRTPGSWASSQGMQLAINGDFFHTDIATPTLYGDAVGGGSHWPLIQTGLHPDFLPEWFGERYGWIAFGDDWVEFTHTEWVKNSDAYDARYGWYPTEVTAEIPSQTRALVSGFPELVIEGQQYTCSSPTHSSCFPDRTDMRSRHPRTAMGITEDRQTFIVVAVDGRTTGNAGMYGAELASLMFQLGAWEAFNLDGGGSTALWVEGQGYVNDPSGGSARSVANHWGVFAGSGSGRAEAPSSCFEYGGCFPTLVPGAEDELFGDMRPVDLAYDEAQILFREGITNGCQSSPRRHFCPNCEITRAQFVVFVVRAAGIDTSNPPDTPSFSDVPADRWYYPYVEAALAAGITSGCGDGQFCPNNPVNRGQMAAFIRRATQWPRSNPDTPTFTDVPADHTHFRAIETLADYCVTNGCGGGNYCPSRRATRAEAAVFLARAFDLEDANACYDVNEHCGNGVDDNLDGDVDCDDLMCVDLAECAPPEPDAGPDTGMDAGSDAELDSPLLDVAEDGDETDSEGDADLDVAAAGDVGDTVANDTNEVTLTDVVLADQPAEISAVDPSQARFEAGCGCRTGRQGQPPFALLLVIAGLLVAASIRRE